MSSASISSGGNLRKRAAATSKEPSPPVEILEPGQQDAIVTDLLEEAVAAQKMQTVGVIAVQLLLAATIFLIYPLQTKLTTFSCILLIISAFVPPLHPRLPEVIVALAILPPVIAFLTHAEGKSVIWASSGAIIIGIIVKGSAKNMVDDARGLEKLKYKAPEA